MQGDYEVGKALADELGIEVPEEKTGSAADRAIRYVLGTGAELFHDQYGNAFITFDNDQKRKEVWPLKGSAASGFVRWCYYQAEQKGLSGEALATVRGTLAAKARFEEG